jgi:hypothetical protein
MANFENTSNGLIGCFDAIKKALEDGKTLDEFLAELSSDKERRGFDVLLTACKKFLDVAEGFELDPADR